MTPMPQLPELLTIKQAAAALNVHANTLRNWERDGLISSIRIGNRRDRRFAKSQIWEVLTQSSHTVSA